MISQEPFWWDMEPVGIAHVIVMSDGSAVILAIAAGCQLHTHIPHESDSQVPHTSFHGLMKPYAADA